MPPLPPLESCTLATAFATLDALSPHAKKALAKLGHATVGELLGHYPRRYEDRTRFDTFPNAPTERAVCLRGKVTDTAHRRFGRQRIFEATLEEVDGGLMSNPVVCRWFNLPFIHKLIAADHELIVFGRIRESGQRLAIDHPEYEIVEPDAGESAIHLGRITPIYPLREGVAQRTLRRLIHLFTEALDAASVPSYFESEAFGIPGLIRGVALRSLHFPADFEALAQARRYLAFEEFLALQLNVALRRTRHFALPGASHAGKGALLRDFAASLPFDLTSAQKRAIREIRADLKAPRPMNRLLQGDVGSGKTFVALAAMLLAVESGCQAALMAPTQILAEQHYLVFRRWLRPLGVRIALRTGSRHDDGSDDTPAPSEPPQILIGTHALLHGKVAFDNLGLVVIDEQHKFGVQQRGRLVARGVVPDVLVMTATPIPRTLTLTVYGDLDVSVLDELPAGRGRIVTALRDPKKTPEAARFLIEHIDQGRQAYIVYPLIEESEKLKALSAGAEFEQWAARLSPRVCDLLHGKVAPEEKDAIMRDFRNGKTDVLVATTVIEVGVDVPNATLMLVYNAERFGLAQLHQLRGRIGRGEHKSYCILMCDPKNTEAVDRLRILEQSTDGFRIAEEDLRLRGPGEILGTAQSGLAGLRLGDLLTDFHLVQQARDHVRRILEVDPGLADPENARLLELVSVPEVAGWVG